MKKLKLIFTIFIALVVLSALAVGLFQHLFKHASVVELLNKLSVEEIQYLEVYEGDWPRGQVKKVESFEKIKRVVASIKSGERYFPNHDQHNGFERVVIIQPQNLQLRIYQTGKGSSPVVVGLGEWSSDSSYRSYGSLQCEDPDAWTSL